MLLYEKMGKFLNEEYCIFVSLLFNRLFPTLRNGTSQWRFVSIFFVVENNSYLTGRECLRMRVKLKQHR
jgi:hypothetical protein